MGGETAFLLATRFSTLLALRKASDVSLSNIEGVGPIIGHSVAEWFQDKNNGALLSRLLKHLKVQKVAAPVQGSLTGKVVVITGTLPTLSREEAEARIRLSGGKVSASVSSKTSFVVAGEAAGSKLADARKINIPVIDEAKFLKRTERKGV